MEAMRTRPSVIARRRSARAWFNEGRPDSVTALCFNTATGLALQRGAETKKRERPRLELLPLLTTIDWFADSLTTIASLCHATDHEAHVRVARERRGLEHALHDQRLNLAVDLQDDHAGEFLARVDLLPELALVLEDVEQLVDALQTVGFLDGSGVTRRRAVDQDLGAGDSHHRRLGHVDRVLGVRQLHVLVDGQLARGREAR